MEQIRAFVGHSFNEEDEQLVHKLLKFLTTISHTLPNFSWTNAQGPEPRGIDEKVLDLFSGKNLLIGICTKKERVVAATAAPWWIPRGKVVANDRDLEWKTSDWIIQEIGLATGRGMDVILLVENGVRKPGGLQGSLEYVPFSREAPEACFNPLLEMISSLVPRSKPVAGTETAAGAAPVIEDTPAASKEPDWTVPKPDWEFEDFDTAMFFAIHQKDLDKQALLNEKFFASSAGRIEEARLRWRASCLQKKVRFGDASAFVLLKDVAAKAPRDPDVVESLADSYVYLSEFAMAAVEFERAASLRSDKPTEQVRLLGQAALMSHRAGYENPKYAELVREMVSHAPNAECAALHAELRLAEVRGDDSLLVGVLERLLAIDPSNFDNRFALAYKYGDMGRDDLAVHHYLKIPEASRSAIAWNNLGVSFERLGLPGKSVRAYREAEAAGETLAASNLAIRLLDAGFVPEAKKILETAQNLPNHSKNVDSTMSRAKGVDEDEAEKEKSALSEASAVSAFYREFGSAATRKAPNLAGTWKSPQCPLAVVHASDSFLASGQFPERLGLLALALANHSGVSGDHPPSLIEVEYRGKVHGRAVTVTKTAHRPGKALVSAASTLLGNDESTTVLMWLSDDGTTLACMERVGTASPTYYSIVRQS
jgi:tetratricopeptide (TPR) repeat protein